MTSPIGAPGACASAKPIWRKIKRFKANMHDAVPATSLQLASAGTAGRPALTKWLLERRWIPEIAPASGASCLVVVALIWNLWTPIHWEAGFPILLLSALALPICILSAYRGRLPKVTEVLFYLNLYYIFVFFSIQLTYHCIALGYPFQDTALSRIDAAIGFDWLSWANFIKRRPLLLTVTNWSYSSYAWQPLVMIPLLAVLKPRRGNSEMFLSLLIAMTLTLIIAIFVPAVGPADGLGLRAESAVVIRALHSSPTAQALKYTGVVAVPSFHTIMAILFTFACRGIRFLFPAAVCLNLMMLVSVPFAGDHYLVDMVTGAIVALTAIVAVTLFESDRDASIRREPTAKICLVRPATKGLFDRPA
jgi:hypothetical protein